MVISKGAHKLTEEFEYMKVKESKYYQMSSSQEIEKKRFSESTMLEGRKQVAATMGSDGNENEEELTICAQQTGLLLDFLLDYQYHYFACQLLVLSDLFLSLFLYGNFTCDGYC